MFNHEFISPYYEELRNAGVDLILLPAFYGGPDVLAKYKAVIEIPYQTSTMKV